MHTEFEALLGLFREIGDDLSAAVEIVEADDVPHPYHDLLVHQDHMTVALERWYGSTVELIVLGRKRGDPYYSRIIQLRLAGSDRVVEYGIMRIDLRACGDDAREQIIAGVIPLGRILRTHNLLTRVQVHEYLRVDPTPAILRILKADESKPFYARLATIRSGGVAVVDLFEAMPADVNHS